MTGRRGRLGLDHLDLGLVAGNEVGDGPGRIRPRPHEAAPAPMAGDEAVAREDAQRLADRGAAHPELREQLHLGGDGMIAAPLARFDPPAQDPLDLQVAGNGWMIGNPGGCHDLYRTQYITYVIRVKGGQPELVLTPEENQAGTPTNWAREVNSRRAGPSCRDHGGCGLPS